MEELMRKLQYAKTSVAWLLEHESGLVDMHSISYTETVMEQFLLWIYGWSKIFEGLVTVLSFGALNTNSSYRAVLTLPRFRNNK